MKKSLLIFITLTLLNLVNNQAFATSLNKEATESLITNMYGTISTQDPRLIKRFFEYYVDPNTLFILQLTGIDSDNHIEKPHEAVLTKQRDQFVEYLLKIIKSFYSVSYQVKVNSFTLADDHSSAIASITIEEKSVTVIPKPQAIGQNIKVETKAASNCNVNLIQAASTPIISGMNCVEKIVIK